MGEELKHLWRRRVQDARLLVAFVTKYRKEGQRVFPSDDTIYAEHFDTRKWKLGTTWGYPEMWFDVGAVVLLGVAVLAGIVITQWISI